MINLIPNQEKKSMIRDFRYRLMVMILIVLSLVMFIASIALLPSYFASASKKNLVNQQLSDETKEYLRLADEKILKAVSDLDWQLSLIEKNKQDQFLISERVISELIQSKTTDIKITQISFRDDAGDRQININGIAGSRSRLASFQNALEANPMFNEVDLPISNFVQDSNIQFFLTLKPI